MNIWDATFKEKAAGGRVEVCGFHVDRVYIAGLLRFNREPHPPLSAYPTHIVSNLLLAAHFCADPHRYYGKVRGKVQHVLKKAAIAARFVFCE
jgi:hypothetical protein